METDPQILHRLWKDIEKHVTKRDKITKLTFAYQGEPITIGSIRASDDYTITAVKKVLSKTFGLKLKSAGDKHGSSGKYITQVTLGALEKDDITRINNLLVSFAGEKTTQKTDKVLKVLEQPQNQAGVREVLGQHDFKAEFPEVSEQPDPQIEITETVEQQNHQNDLPEVSGQSTENIKMRASRRRSFTKIVNNIASFEGIKIPIRYRDTKDEAEMILTDTAKSAKMIALILKWIIGPDALVVRDKNTVLVDCKDYHSLREKDSAFTFCFPPKIETVEEIKKRLARITTGIKTHVTENEKFFAINVARRKMVAEKLFKNLEDMGWPVALTSEMEILISKKKVKETPIAKPAQPAIENFPSPSSDEEKLEASLDNPIIKEEVKEQIHKYFRDKEAAEKIKKANDEVLEILNRLQKKL